MAWSAPATRTATARARGAQTSNVCICLLFDEESRWKGFEKIGYCGITAALYESAGEFVAPSPRWNFEGSVAPIASEFPDEARHEDQHILSTQVSDCVLGTR